MSLRSKLDSNQFVITAELSPPKGPDVSELIQKAKWIQGSVDAANLTDNNRAIMCMSALAAAVLVMREGIEPILQFTCRDKNRMAIQSDLLGAHALGVRNVLGLTGDPVRVGDHPDAKEVHDIDSLHLLKAMKDLNNGVNIAGKEVNGKTDFFIAGAANPGAKDIALEISKFSKKVESGANFFQTQGIFIVESFVKFMELVRPFSPKVIAGIILLKSAKMARFLNEKVPGVKVPDEYIEVLEKASDPIEAGIQIAARTIKELQGIASGVHLMCIGREDLIPRIVKAANLSK